VIAKSILIKPVSIRWSSVQSKMLSLWRPGSRTNPVAAFATLQTCAASRAVKRCKGGERELSDSQSHSQIDIIRKYHKVIKLVSQRQRSSHLLWPRLLDAQSWLNDSTYSTHQLNFNFLAVKFTCVKL
jgi:hypothetical protein